MKAEKKKTILLVEDDAVTALVEEAMIRRFGYEVVIANSGEQAVRLAAGREEIDLVLMDIDLGAGMDGTEAAALILAKRNLPIVFLTLHAEQEYVERVRKITRYGYVIKNSGDFVLQSSIEMAFTLFEAYEALKKSALLLIDTGEMAQVGGWEYDLATHEVSWTEEVCRIHGVEPGYRPKLEEALNFYVPESRPDVEAVLKKAMETGEPYDLESLFMPAGAREPIWVRSLGKAIYRGGKIVKLAGTFQNIDKYKRTEEARRLDAEELTRVNRELEQFVTVASHDIQEPLRVISSFLQLLEKRCWAVLDDKGQDYLRRAAHAAQRAQLLIHDLLVYSAISAGAARPFSPCRIESLLKAAMENLQVAIEKSRAVITHDPLPVVEGDESQLLRLFQNILSNAIKFSDKEYPLIHVRAHDKGTEWQLSFRDNGIGIAPEHVPLLFAIFTHLHPRNEYPGTGIGLAICKKIVERHGGRIWVESELGKGSTFFISIPKRKRG